MKSPMRSWRAKACKAGRNDLRFAPDAEQAIRHYSWPGNVRELENAVERAVILCESPDISAELLGIDIELSDLDVNEFIGLAPQASGSSSSSWRADRRLVAGGLLPALRPGASGPHDRNRAGSQAGGQPQVPVGASSTPGHSATQDRSGQRNANASLRRLWHAGYGECEKTVTS